VVTWSLHSKVTASGQVEFAFQSDSECYQQLVNQNGVVECKDEVTTCVWWKCIVLDEIVDLRPISETCRQNVQQMLRANVLVSSKRDCSEHEDQCSCTV